MGAFQDPLADRDLEEREDTQDRKERKVKADNASHDLWFSSNLTRQTKMLLMSGEKVNYC